MSGLVCPRCSEGVLKCDCEVEKPTFKKYDVTICRVCENFLTCCEHFCCKHCGCMDNCWGGK